jgi:hypothetical protein
MSKFTGKTSLGRKKICRSRKMDWATVNWLTRLRKHSLRAALEVTHVSLLTFLSQRCFCSSLGFVVHVSVPLTRRINAVVCKRHKTNHIQAISKYTTVRHPCDRLCSLVVRVLGYRSGGPGSITGTTRKKVVGLECGPLSLVSTTEELLDRKVAAPV